MPSPTDAVFTQSIVGCARCWGAGHDDLRFRKFAHPIELEIEGEMVIIASHWSMCPTTGEPIMLRFEENDLLAQALEDES